MEIWLTVVCGLLSMVVLFLVRKDGQKSERLRQIKAEIERNAKEQERANAIFNNVDNMPIDDVNKRLQNAHRK